MSIEAHPYDSYDSLIELARATSTVQLYEIHLHYKFTRIEEQYALLIGYYIYK